MIVYTSKDSFLEIPKGLGNFSSNNGGGGGGEDLRPLSGSVVTLSAVTVSVASGLDELSAQTENIGSQVGSMASEVETLTGSVETLSSEVDSQGDAIADLLLDVDGLDTRVSANTEDIAALSGAVEGMEVKAYYLDRMTKTERAALFSEIWTSNGESNFDAAKYKFYELEDTDEFKGWAEVRLARFDSGRKVYFSAIFQSRNSSKVFQRGISIAQDGTYKKDEYQAVVPLVDVTPISAQTTANTAQIETLSAATEALSAVTSGLASTVSEMAGKQASIYDWDAFYASNDYSERRAIYSAFTQDFAEGKMVLMKGTTSDGSIIYLHLEKVNTSSPYLASFRYESDGGYTNIGITSSGNESGDYNNSGKLTRNKLAAASASTLANSAYTRADSAYTLASSAYTLADSLTGQTGGPQVIFLNKLTEQERLALYNELASKYDQNTQSWTSAYTEDEYAFFIDLRDYADQETYQTNDHYEGFFPMQLERMHPSDYGGAAFFGGVESAREGNGNLIQIRFVITFEGGYENSTWWNSPSSDPTMQFNLRINSDGTIANDQDWSYIADSNNATRVVMQYYEGTQYGDIYSEGKVKWVNMYPTTYNNETKWYWIWAADICVGTTMYSGVWGMLQDQWYTSSDVPPQVLQWTSGAAYESQTYPSII